MVTGVTIGDWGTDNPLNTLTRNSKFMNSFYSVFAIDKFFLACLQMCVITAQLAVVDDDIEKAKKGQLADISVKQLQKKKKGILKEKDKQESKILFYFFLLLIPPFVYLIYKILVLVVMNTDVLGEVPHKVFDVILNVFVFLKLIKAVIMFIYAIYKLIRTIAKYTMIKNQLNIEDQVRENFRKNVQIQSVYIFLKYYTSIFNSMRFNLNFLEKEFQMIKFNGIIGEIAYRRPDPVKVTEKVSINSLETNFEVKTGEQEIPEEKIIPKNTQIKLITFGEPPSSNKKAIEILNSIDNPNSFNQETVESNIEAAGGYIYPFVDIKKANKEERGDFKSFTDQEFFFTFCEEAAEFCYRYWDILKEFSPEPSHTYTWRRLFHPMAMGPIIQPEIISFDETERKDKEHLYTRYYNKLLMPEEIIVSYRRSFYSNKFLKDIVLIDEEDANFIANPKDELAMAKNIFEIGEKLSEGGKYEVQFYQKHKFIFFIFSNINSLRSLVQTNIFNPLAQSVSKDAYLPAVRSLTLKRDRTTHKSLIGDINTISLDPNNYAEIEVFTMRWKEFSFFNLSSEYYHVATDNSLDYKNAGCVEIERYDYVCNGKNKQGYPEKSEFPLYILACKSTENKTLGKRDIYRAYPVKLNYQDFYANCQSQIVEKRMGKEVLYKRTLQKGETKMSLMLIPTDESQIDGLLQKIRGFMDSYKQNSCDQFKKIKEMKADAKFKNCFPYANYYIKTFFFNKNRFPTRIYLENVIPAPYVPGANHAEVTLEGNDSNMESYQYTNENKLDNALLTMKQYAEGFQNRLLEKCKKEKISAKLLVDKPLIPDEMGFFYAHDTLPPSEKQITKSLSDPKGDSWTKSIKGKALFGYGDSNTCFDRAVLHPRYRFLVPLKKEHPESKFYFQMFKALDYTNKQKKEIKGYVFKLVELTEEEDMKERELTADENYDSIEVSANEGEENDYAPEENGKTSDYPEGEEITDLEFAEGFEDVEEGFMEKLNKYSALNPHASKNPLTKDSREKDNKMSKKIALAHTSTSTKLTEAELKKNFILNVNPFGYKIDYANIYKFYYVEWWFNKYYWQKDRVEYIMHLNSNEIKGLLDKCFVPYWPQTKRDYKNLSEEEEAYTSEKGVLPDFAPSGDLFASLYYNRNKSVAYRLWVQFDYRTTYEEHVFQRDGGCSFTKKKNHKAILAKKKSNLA